MKPDSAGGLIMRLQKIVQAWDWSLAMSGVLELRNERDQFVVSGNVHEIAVVVKREALYRARRPV